MLVVAEDGGLCTSLAPRIRGGSGRRCCAAPGVVSREPACCTSGGGSGLGGTSASPRYGTHCEGAGGSSTHRSYARSCMQNIVRNLGTMPSAWRWTVRTLTSELTVGFTRWSQRDMSPRLWPCARRATRLPPRSRCASGYRHLSDHLDGAMDLDEAIRLTQRDTEICPPPAKDAAARGRI